MVHRTGQSSSAAESLWSCRHMRQIAQNHSLGDSHLAPFTQSQFWTHTHTHIQRAIDPWRYNACEHPPNAHACTHTYNRSLIQLTFAACQNWGHSHSWQMSAKQTWADEEMGRTQTHTHTYTLCLSLSVHRFVCPPDPSHVCLSQCFSLNWRCFSPISLINLFNQQSVHTR